MTLWWGGKNIKEMGLDKIKSENLIYFQLWHLRVVSKPLVSDICLALRPTFYGTLQKMKQKNFSIFFFKHF